MTFTLYNAVVPTFQQMLTALIGLLDRAEAHCAEKGVAPEALLQARLADDMWPFTAQVRIACDQSRGGIEGVRKGVYSPNTAPPPDTFAGLRAEVVNALNVLDAVKPEEVNGWIGRDMRFEFGERKMPFTAEDFLLSFSLPNFYFHVTTAYALLRNNRVSIGKRDYLGPVRLKMP